MRRLASVAVAVATVWSVPAVAQEQKQPPQQQPRQDSVKVVQEADRTVYRKKTVIDFSDVAVEGELTKPEGSYVLNRKKTDFQSLIKVRENFVPELQKSVDNL